MKKVSLFLVCVIVLTLMVGCGSQNASVNTSKVTIKIGAWPGESASEATRNQAELNLARMNEKYPDIEVIKDTSTYDHKSFTLKASSNQLPTLYQTHFTEFKKIVNSGYAADITDYVIKNGYADSLNPLLKEFVSVDNKYYAMPKNAYALGLACNRKLFEQAGLVNDDGSIKVPATYEELTDYAKIIKEKTGAYGIALPTMNNEGGWFFSMIAWAYGTNFIESLDNGKYKATFNTQECRDALKLYKDWKWEYGVVPDNAFLSRDDARKLFATNQVAMYFDAGPSKTLTTKYNMNKDDIVFIRVPEGKNGRISLMGGAIYMLSKNVTPEQIDAVFKWIDVCGEGPNMSDYALEAFESSLQADVADNAIVTDRDPFSVWTNEELIQKRNGLRKKYTNVDPKHISDYCDFEDVVLRPEEYPACQQLYSILDEGIQKVYSEKNADIAATVSEMANKFQTNHLDKWEEN